MTPLAYMVRAAIDIGLLEFNPELAAKLLRQVEDEARKTKRERK